MSDLLILFGASFLAATILPAQSEAVLAGFYIAGGHDGIVLVALATLGNVLGACVNWLLGRYMLNLRQYKWFPVTEAALERATRIY